MKQVIGLFSRDQKLLGNAVIECDGWFPDVVSLAGTGVSEVDGKTFVRKHPTTKPALYTEATFEWAKDFQPASLSSRTPKG